MQLEKGTLRVTIEVEDNDVTRYKKRYFAMVTELGKWLGYQSHSDRESFKEYIKRELGNESIAEMTTAEQVRIKIEELHELAAIHHNFIFTNNDPDIFRFDQQGNGQQDNPD